MRGPSLSEDQVENNRQINNRLTVDYSEYMWMGREDLEEFDRQFLDQLEEEGFYERCIEELEESLEQGDLMMDDDDEGYPDNVLDSVDQDMAELSIYPNLREVVSASKLNPEAPEFVPRWLNRSISSETSARENPDGVNDEPNH